MNRMRIMWIGYITAVFGVIAYLLTKSMTGIIVGGGMLCVTSIINVIGNTRQKEQQKKETGKRK